MRFEMKFGYVVLYVNSVDSSLEFWIERVGMVEKGRNQVGPFSIVKVGYADQEFAFELVPLELMKDNPDNLDLATPSIAFYVSNLNEVREGLMAKEVEVSEIANHSGISTFGFSDNESHWFAVLEK
jgi:lactoylglutathione lyase